MNKVYIVGDSILKGIVYDPQSDKYRFGNEMKLHALEQLGFKVVNLSKMGATVNKGFEILKNKVASDLTGDIVILGFGGNDCNFDWKQVSSGNTQGILPFTPILEFECVYQKCVAYARSLGARVMCVNLVPLDDEKYIDWISKGLSKENILAWLGDKSMLYRWHETYNQRVCELIRDLRCDSIDIRSPFLFAHDYKELMCSDGIHPTEKGYALISNAICSSASRTLQLRMHA